MSAKVDKFCSNLRDRLNAIEARVESAKANVEALPGKADVADRLAAADCSTRHLSKQEVRPNGAVVAALPQLKVQFLAEALHVDVVSKNPCRQSLHVLLPRDFDQPAQHLRSKALVLPWVRNQNCKFR